MRGFILFISSVLLFWIIYPFTIAYTFFKLLFTDFKGLNNWFFDMAVSVDQFGNVSSKAILQDTMTKKDSYKFGKPDETISSVIGKNKKQKNLSFFGKCLDFMLNLFESNHSIKAIEHDE